MPLRIGETFAGYRILRLLGSGGMGEVYLAEHPRLPRRDALKILAADVSADPEFRSRFNREADLASTMYHPHIVGVHDRGEHGGQLWISMDYVEGPDAVGLIRDRYPAGLPRREAIEIIAAVAQALDYAHEKGLLHRDVKPANILLAEELPKSRRVLLADFGIARSMTEIVGLTKTNVAVGTVYYAAPEQLMGLPLDGRGDQYALAVTAYQLFTGVLPFEHSNPAVIISHHLNASPPPLSQLRPELADLDPVLAVALSKDPGDRFSTCNDFANALKTARANAGSSATSVRPTAPAPVVQKKLTPSAAEKRRVPPATKKITPKQPPPIVVHESRPRWPVVVSTIALIILLAGVAVALVVRPWENNGSSNGSTSAPTTSTAPSITFDSMSDFVSRYYRDLPSHPQDAWAKLDTYAQNQTGEQQFLDFWSTIESVIVISISPRDPTSVTARLSYVRRGGQTDAEDRWLRVALVDGAILLHESERISAVSQTALPNTSSVSATTSAVPSSVLPPGRNATSESPLAAFCADNAAQLQRTFHESGLDPAQWASDPRNLARFGFQGPGDIDTLYHMVIDKGAPYISSSWSNENGRIEWRCSGQ
jgi:serine/threonine-protein kinase